MHDTSAPRCCANETAHPVSFIVGAIEEEAEKQIDITWGREAGKWAFTILCKITKNWFFIFRAKKKQ
ncbi:hypothetical protein ACPJXG_06195 [Janthinobacterium sp. NFX145]|uniref:hypothetical protein n=1 Tax=Janthinobacterium sp. NFX145 TaxID=3415602 RepID=UPI003CC669BE